GGLRDLARHIWLARVVCGRRAPSAVGDLHSRQGSRIAGVAAAKTDDELLGKPGRHPEAALAVVHLRHSANDGFQRHVARHPGHVSDFSGRTTRPQREGKIDYWNYLRSWRDLRGNPGGSSFAKVWPSSLDHSHCDR